MMFAEDKSELTLRNYEVDLEHFARWLGATDVPQAIGAFLSLSLKEANQVVLLYKSALRKAPVYRSRAKREEARQAAAEGKRPPEPDKVGYSANTINRRLTALKSVTSVARLMGFIDWRIEIKGVAAQALPDTKGCGADGYQTLIDTLESEIEEEDDRERVAIKRRDLVLVRLMHDTGLRRAEPLSANFPDDLRMRHKEKQIRIKGKKRIDKEWVVMSDAAAAAVKAWLSARGRHKGPLFTSFHPSHYGRRLTPQAVNGMLKRLAKRAGVEVTPHGFRHTATTTLLDAGVPIREVQAWGRWKNLEMVEIYDRNRSDKSGKLANLLSGTQEEETDD